MWTRRRGFLLDTRPLLLAIRAGFGQRLFELLHELRVAGLHVAHEVTLCLVESLRFVTASWAEVREAR